MIVYLRCIRCVQPKTLQFISIILVICFMHKIIIASIDLQCTISIIVLIYIYKCIICITAKVKLFCERKIYIVINIIIKRVIQMSLFKHCASGNDATFM